MIVFGGSVIGYLSFSRSLDTGGDQSSVMNECCRFPATRHLFFNLKRAGPCCFLLAAAPMFTGIRFLTQRNVAAAISTGVASLLSQQIAARPRCDKWDLVEVAVKVGGEPDRVHELLAAGFKTPLDFSSFHLGALSAPMISEEVATAFLTALKATTASVDDSSTDAFALYHPLIRGMIASLGAYEKHLFDDGPSQASPSSDASGNATTEVARIAQTHSQNVYEQFELFTGIETEANLRLPDKLCYQIHLDLNRGCMTLNDWQDLSRLGSQNSTVERGETSIGDDLVLSKASATKVVQMSNSAVALYECSKLWRAVAANSFQPVARTRANAAVNGDDKFPSANPEAGKQMLDPTTRAPLLDVSTGEVLLQPDKISKLFHASLRNLFRFTNHCSFSAQSLTGDQYTIGHSGMVTEMNIFLTEGDTLGKAIGKVLSTTSFHACAYSFLE